MVIGAAGLVAMGAIVAGGSFLKGFQEGLKTEKDAGKKEEEAADPPGPNKASKNTTNASDSTAKAPSSGSEKTGVG